MKWCLLYFIPSVVLWRKPEFSTQGRYDIEYNGKGKCWHSSCNIYCCAHHELGLTFSLNFCLDVLIDGVQKQVSTSVVIPWWGFFTASLFSTFTMISFWVRFRLTYRMLFTYILLPSWKQPSYLGKDSDIGDSWSSCLVCVFPIGW